MLLTNRKFGTQVRCAIVFVGLALCAQADPAVPPTDGAPSKPAEVGKKLLPQPLKLPGLVINRERRCVDVEASICLSEGSLELIACTKDSKEHESIVVIHARPIHIHTALLLLGARNGNPAMRRAINEEQTRWIDLPPQGDPIDVFLEFKNTEGKMMERPISDFVVRSDEEAGHPGAEKAENAEADKFPSTFIFAGSQLSDPKKAPREYLADLSGNVISIATFGDELLCLPEIQSHENGALMWRIDSTHLPELGTKVTLRLCLKKKPVTQPKP